MDGARIFNAVVATGTDPARIVLDYDSVSICLSKGLGAPVGSILVGSTEFIAEAHRWRKMFGGGMRQAGIIAAAGIYALDNNIESLAEDHTRAQRFAESINKLKNYSVNLDTVQTNMVYVDLIDGRDAEDMVSRLAEKGVDLLDISPTSLRAVFHLHVTDEDVDSAIEAFSSLQ